MKELIRKIKTKKFFNDKAILCKKDYSGRTIAHLQASYGWRTSDIDILKLTDKKGWTVAHEMASNGWETNDKEIMKLSNNTGWTVAHEMALKGTIILEEEILFLEDKNNLKVYELLFESNRNEFIKKSSDEIKRKIIL